MRRRNTHDASTDARQPRALSLLVLRCTPVIARGQEGVRDAVGPPTRTPSDRDTIERLDGIVVTQDTLRLLRGRFVTEDFGAVPVKGLSDPVPAHRLCGRVAMAEEFAAGSVPLVGRDAELSALLQSWAQVVAGTGRAVLIAGDPGIGKSRLVEALADGIGGERHVWLRMQGAPYHVNSAFHAVARAVQRQLGVRASDPPERRVAALEQLLGATGGPAVATCSPRLGTLLGDGGAHSSRHAGGQRGCASPRDPARTCRLAGAPGGRAARRGPRRGRPLARSVDARSPGAPGRAGGGVTHSPRAHPAARLRSAVERPPGSAAARAGTAQLGACRRARAEGRRRADDPGAHRARAGGACRRGAALRRGAHQGGARVGFARGATVAASREASHGSIW